MDGSHHTEELHLQRVSALCRLCGRRSKKAFDDRKVLLCKTYAADLYAFHQIDISSDTASKHSDTLCRPCYMRVMRLKRSKVPSYLTLQAAKEDIDESSDIWCEFSSLKSADQCSVCAKFLNQIRGGRPTKPKKGGKRSATVSEVDYEADSNTVAEHDISTESTFARQGPSTSTPKRLCTHTSTDTLFVSSQVQTSPIKKQETNTDQQTPPRTKMFADCTTSPLEKFSLRSIHNVTLPLTKEEEAYHTHLTRMKMGQSDDKLTLTCKTRGQPLIFKKVVKPRKASTVVSSPVRKRRATLMNKIRMDVSGGSVEDEIKQQSTEIKKATKQKRTKLLEAVGYKKSFLSRTKALAMRTACGLSWTQHRKQRKFLKDSGIDVESEKKQRTVQKEIRCGTVQTEKRMLSNSNGDMLETPVAFIESIPDFVKSVLDQYDQNNKLTWHNGTIPSNEIWIKVGGDHGGGSFSLLVGWLVF